MLNDQIFRALCVWMGTEGNPRPLSGYLGKWWNVVWHGDDTKEESWHLTAIGPDCVRVYHFVDECLVTTSQVESVAHLHELLEQIK